MNQYRKKMYDLAGPKTVEALNKRRFEAYYCSTAAEAVVTSRIARTGRAIQRLSTKPNSNACKPTRAAVTPM